MEDQLTASLVDKDFRDILRRVIEAHKEEMPKDYHVVVKLKLDKCCMEGPNEDFAGDPTGARYCHYVADHDRNSIFWLDTNRTFDIDIAEFGLRYVSPYLELRQ